MGLTALFLNMFSQMIGASLPVLAFQDFDGDRGSRGSSIAGFGAGAVVGSAVAVKLAPRFDPVRLGALGVVAWALPLPLLGLPLPAAGVISVLFVSSIFGPLANAPLISVLTMRSPEALRPKVMTALLTMAMLAGPLGLLIVGPLLAAWGPRPVMFSVAVAQILASLPLAIVALRGGGREPVVEPEAA